MEIRIIMTSTGLEEFDNTIQKTNELLKEIETAFGWEDRRNQSYGALRAVLHTIRDMLLPEEAVQLSAQLPLLIKGIYFDGWNPSKTPKRLNREEFLNEIRRQFPFSIEGDIGSVIRVVLTALKKHISLGEAQDIVSGLPKDIKILVSDIL